MKNTMMAAMVVVATAVPAAAVDLGANWSWDTEWTSQYNLTTKKFSSELETGPVYRFDDQFAAYALGRGDVRAGRVNDIEVGVLYTPRQIRTLEARAFVRTDNQLKNRNVIVETKFKF